MNAFEQYSAPLKGIDLHFIHERGDGDDPVPILLLHGWAELGVGVPQDDSPAYGQHR